MKVFIDSEYRCHTTNPDGFFREVETDFFDGKCQAVIEGYRYIPPDESWMREDGEEFNGEMFSPATDYEPLGIAQKQYELDMAEAAASYQEGVNSV